MPRFRRILRRAGVPLFPGRRRPFGPPTPLPPGLLQALAQANTLLAQGQFAPAAEKFEMLANAARAGNLRFAPRLYFQAARANWQTGRFPQGMQLLRNGLGILVTAGALGAVRRNAAAAMVELETLGRTQETEEIKKFLSGIPGGEESAAETAAAPIGEVRPTLPTNCGQCGAVVRTEEIEWIDNRTAECAYCGSPIRPKTG